MGMKGKASSGLRTEQLMLYAAGVVLLASGSLHVLIWLTEGGSLEGPVSWRKPILFGFSAGATLLSLGWVIGTIRRRAGDTVFMGTLALAMLVEVGLITLQQWRGVASHFNRASALDTSILNIIEVLIVLVTVAIADLTWRSFRPLRASVDVALAVRGGMLLLLFSCILGFVLVAWGNHQITLGLPPETFGTAGVMKFPHGVPMHAVQALPIFAWLLWKLGVPESQRTRAIAYMIGSMVAFTAYSLLQTFTGRARFEPWWLSTVVLIASAALLMVPLWIGVTWTMRLCSSSAAR